MIILALLTGFVLRWTKFGRHAIGGNEHAATLTGVPVKPIKVAVYHDLRAWPASRHHSDRLAGRHHHNIGAGLELLVTPRPSSAAPTSRRRHRLRRACRRGADQIIRNSLGLLGINAFLAGHVIGGAIVLAVMFDRIRNFRQSE